MIIANSSYPGRNHLTDPVNDARAMREKLESLGFTVTMIPDAGREQMVRSLAAFSKTASRADLALFFYAGHGVQIAGINYLVPIDTNLNDRAQARLHMVLINDTVDQLRGKIKPVFLDACRNDPLPLLTSSGSRGITRGLAPISVSEGTLVSYATKD
ncbi:MAG: caspase domain-containing protein, partial [Betaproteobacteria bacterium]